jgi:hypothetical protein
VNIPVGLISSSIEIFANTGRLVLKETAHELTTQVNTSKLPAGSYQVSIISNKQVIATEKLIRE